MGRVLSTTPAPARNVTSPDRPRVLTGTPETQVATPDSVERMPTPMGSDSLFVSTPAYEQLLQNTTTTLREQGFDSTTINNFVQPAGFMRSEDPLDFPRMFEALRPGFEDSAAAAMETWEQAESLKKNGVDLDPSQTSALRMMLLDFVEQNGPNAVAGMAKSNKWWRQFKREFAESTAGHMAARGLNELGLGLASLDFWTWLNKKQKLLFVPADERSDVEARVLPKITLEDHKGRAKEFANGTTAAWWILQQRAKGVAMAGLSAIPMSSPEFKASMLAGAAQRFESTTNQQIPTLLASLGPELKWQEVAERNIDHGAPGTVDSLYATMNDLGEFGKMEMLGVSVAGGLADIFLDATMVASGLPSKVAKLGGPVARLANSEGAALQASKIAQKVGKYPEALDAVAEANRHLKRMEALGQREAKAAGRMKTETARKIVLARKQVRNEEAWLAGFEDPGTAQKITLRRSPRRAPGLDNTDLKPYSDSPEVAEELRQARRAELSRDLDAPASFDGADPGTFGQRALLGPDDSEQAGDALNQIVRTGGVGIDDVMLTPGAVEYQAIPDTKAGLIKWPRGVPATKEEVEFGNLTKYAKSDLSKSTIKMLLKDLGDTRKALGEARNRKIAYVDEAGQTVIRPDKDLIGRLETKLARTKKLAKDLAKQDFHAESAKYDDIWLPGAADPMRATPEGYHKWLEVARDRVTEGLYPGSLQLSKFWDTRFGQAFAWAREPMRFFDTYDPETSEMLRGSYLRFKRDNEAWNEQILTMAEEAGVVTRRSKWDPRSHFKPFSIDETKNQQLFDLLDTKPGAKEYEAMRAKADPKIVKMHDEVRRILDYAADTQGISDDPRYLSGYIRHFFTEDQFANGARPLEYIGLPAKAEVFAAHLLNRKGMAGYQRDALLALDLYGRAMHRKMYLEPMFEDVLMAGENLAAAKNNPMFSKYSNMLVNHLKGKPSYVGAMIDEFVGGAANANGTRRWLPGATDRALLGMTGLFWAGTLAGNPRYPVMQIATGLVTTSSRYGLFRTSKGLFQMATPEGQALAKQIGVYEEFLDVLEAPAMKRFSTMMAHVPAVTPLGPMSTASTEFMIRGTTALAAVDMYLTKAGFESLDAARAAGFEKRILFEAMRATEETNHMFGPLGRTPVASAILPKGMVISGTQFLSFVPKQTEELLAQFEKNPGAIAQYLMLSGWLSRVAAEDFGIDVTSYVGLGYMPEGGDDLTSPAATAFMDMLAMFSAVGNHDPEEATKAQVRLMDTLDNLVPLMVAYETAGKSAERLWTGTVRTGTGEKLRNLDFKGTLDLPAVMRGEKPGTLPQQIAESIRPIDSSIGGDFIPTVTGQKSIRDELFRRGRASILASNREKVFKARNVTRDIVQAAMERDTARLQAKIEEFNTLVANDELRLDSSKPFQAAMEAYSISWSLRELDRNPKYADEILQSLQGAGIKVEP